MIEKLKGWAINFLLKKYALGYLVKGYEKITGYKTQIATGLWVLIWLAERLGYVDPAFGNQIRTGLEVAGGMAFMQKLKRHQGTVDKVVETVKEATAATAAAPKP